MTNFYGFTLAELIVVITILVILWTIAFLNMGNLSLGARDSSRVSDMTSISKGLDLTLVKNGTVPMPDAEGKGIVTVSSGATILGYQGYAGSVVLSVIKMSDAKDPLDKKYYTYSILADRTKYELLGLFEDANTNVSMKWGMVDTVYAGYESRIPVTKGSALGILLNGTGSDLHTPIQEYITVPTTIDIVAYTGSFAGTTIENIKAVFSKDATVNGTGSVLAQPIQTAVTWKGSASTTPYIPSNTYSAGNTFAYITPSGSSITVNVAGPGLGTASTKADNNCNTNDIVIFSGSLIQTWAACNAGANTAWDWSMGWNGSVGTAPMDTYTGVITSSTNFLGNYYQWGRNDPVNLLPSSLTSPSTITQNYQTGGVTLNAGNGFISVSGSSYGAWISDANHLASSGVVWTDANNSGPCTTGYHVPTGGGIVDSTTEWGVAYTIANNSPILGVCNQTTGTQPYDRLRCALALPLAGRRWNTAGAFTSLGANGSYWSSSPNSSSLTTQNVYYASFGSGTGNASNSLARTPSCSVRCIKN